MNNTTPSSRDVSQEIRFAVVLYGGVSLAIYINGVTRELFNLARASAPKDERISPLSPLEEVYAELARELDARFVVDIISGTSAGGINGVALAKALATGRDMAPLSQLWIEEGDIARLINDKLSVAGLGLDKPTGPDSLLNGDRLTLKLCEAFDAMDQSVPVSRPLADEIDLYVTATDLSGLKLSLDLDDPAIAERRYRNVFHLVYAKERASGEDRDDFVNDNNPLLAFAARCTSAFPFAFAPMCLNGLKVLPRYRTRDGDAKLDRDCTRWRHFFRAYGDLDYRGRWFADGGYLDNKPFSYSTETLTRRRSDGRVTRKLLYVEPDPEEIGHDSTAKPNAIDNVLAAAFTLPHAETIREDIERLAARNRVLERVANAVHGVEREIHPDQDTKPEGKQYIDADLEDMVKLKGVSYGSYHRLKVAELTDDLTRLLMQLTGEEDFRTWRRLVREWRDAHYVIAAGGDPADDRPTQNQMLVELDLSYRLRRLAFVRGKIDELYPYQRRAGKEPLVHLDRDGRIPLSLNGKAAGQRQFDDELLRLRALVSDLYTNLRRVGRQLRQGIPSSSVMTDAEWSAQIDAVRDAAIAVQTARAGAARGSALNDAIQHFATAVHRVIKPWTRYAAATMEQALEVGNPLPQGFDGAAAARWCIHHYYFKFDDYDLVTFPIQYGTDIGEAARVDVLRVSPLDARALSKQSRAKLAGTSFGHFGAFLDRGWRANDLLWGRLDAAEILIGNLVGNDPPRADALRRRAQRAIIDETLPLQERRRLVAAMVQHLFGDSAASPPRIEELRARIEQDEMLSVRLKNFLDLCLDATGDELQGHFGDDYALDRQLDPEPTARNLARAATVAGEVLDAVADDYDSQPTAFLATRLTRLGRILWMLVEAASPKGIGAYFGSQWTQLAYVVAIVVILVGTIFNENALFVAGLKGLAASLAVDAVRRMTRRILTGRLRLQNLKRFGVAILAVLAIVGALSIGRTVSRWTTTARQHLGLQQTTDPGSRHEHE